MMTSPVTGSAVAGTETASARAREQPQRIFLNIIWAIRVNDVGSARELSRIHANYTKHHTYQCVRSKSLVSSVRQQAAVVKFPDMRSGTKLALILLPVQGELQHPASHMS